LINALVGGKTQILNQQRQINSELLSGLNFAPRRRMTQALLGSRELLGR
jgi:hypothetical protein